ncbi:hypothetical protein [Acholeplasma hippikon]|uniref:V-type ATP synthase subunit E n=1 Tax=Acholeplasma hippikon TaxID=264636 RepID=A0A449BHU9_9MOLU|nr:hypothetical protein [Acholeplasma hippikon]VEU82012.1 Uncharacterised protein [Acholeplasma hippikon]
MSKLEDKIIAKAELEKNEILSEAKLKASQVYRKMIEEAKDEIEASLEKAKKKHTNSIAQKELEVKKELRDEAALAKQKLVQSVFNEITNYLTNLEGEALFKYVLTGIKNEKVTGHEIIAVNKNDYEKYLSILSSSKGDLVDCDILNSKLGKGFEIKLTKNPVKIKNGFMLIGEEFDLNFSFDETIDKLAQKYEKKIYEELN